VRVLIQQSPAFFHYNMLDPKRLCYQRSHDTESSQNLMCVAAAVRNGRKKAEGGVREFHGNDGQALVALDRKLSGRVLIKDLSLSGERIAEKAAVAPRLQAAILSNVQTRRGRQRERVGSSIVKQQERAAGGQF
jgi:hypothetical protein